MSPNFLPPRKGLLVALVCSLSFFSAFALDPTHFSVTRVTAPYFVVDGNSPATGPLSAYVGLKVSNTSAASTYNNLKLVISSIGTSVSGQNYTVTAPASATIVVGTLAPGESKVCYYYVTYPANTSAVATVNYILSDATVTPKTGNVTISNRSCISANAGGLATQSINSQDLIGGIVYDDVTYTLGNIRNGDEADFQVSVSTQFNPAKLVLLKTQVISSTVPGVVTNTTDQLYFTTTANQSSGTVTIRWTFRISSYNFTSLVLPYAGATSGASNYKYAISTDLGSGTPIIISFAANPLVITKSSDKVSYPGNANAVFTVTVQNPGAYGITIDKITDEVPSGFVYQSIDASSGVTLANSSTVPGVGATGTITFEGGVVSGGNSSYTVPAGSTIQLKYVARAPGAQALNLLTTAKGFIGATQFGTANNTVNVLTTLPLTLVSIRGQRVSQKVKLDWSTANETNLNYFEIERRTSGDEFHKIGQKTAAGNSSALLHYSYIDSFYVDTRVLYRLRMVDRDGRYEYSPVIAIDALNKSGLTATAFPNPFQGKLSVVLSSERGQMIHVSIRDLSGRLLLQQDGEVVAGSNTILIERSDKLKAGLYMLSVTSDNGILTSKIASKN